LTWRLVCTDKTIKTHVVARRWRVLQVLSVWVSLAGRSFTDHATFFGRKERGAKASAPNESEPEVVMQVELADERPEAPG
jgi:hypothetical protein